MSQVINTNIMSLTAQRNLNNTNSALATAMQRLSSGLRINSAKDDAAGLAISTRFTTQINGLNTAVRNANDGISLAQTTESALGELTNNLQAIRQLAVQAANATNSDSDRAALNAEVQQRLAEVTRISQQTTFNGRHVLDGSFGTAAFQIGANVGETIAVDLSQGTKASQIGEMATSGTGNISALFASPAGLTLAAGDLAVNGTDVAAGSYATASALATAIGAAATTAGASLGVTVSGTELALDNSSTTVAVAFTGAKAAALGLSTVAVATVGAGTPGTGSSTGLGAAITAGFNAVTLASGDLTLGAAAGTGSSTGLGAAITAGFNAVTLATGDFTVDGTSITGTFKDVGELASAINAKGITGLTASQDGVTGNLKLDNASGTAMTIGGTLATTDLGIATSVAGGASESSTVTVAAVVGTNKNAVELGAGQLQINGTDLTGVFNDAGSLKTLIDAAAVTGLTTTVNTTDLDFSNTGSAVTFGGSLTALAATLPSVAAGTAGTSVTGTFKDVGELVSAINAMAITGLTASDSAGNLALANASGATLGISGTVATNLGLAATVADSATATSTNTVASAITGNENALELAAGDFTIGGTNVTGVISDTGDLKALIDALSVAGLTTTDTGTDLSFSNTGSSAVAFGGSLTALTATMSGPVAAGTSAVTTDGLAASTGVNAAVTVAAGGTPLTLATGDLTINGTDLSGTYEGARDLVDAINGKGIGGVAAYYDSATKSIHLNSQVDLTVAGTKSGTGTGNFVFSGAGAAIALSGSLDGATVTSVASANDVMSRVDSALTTVSGVRSDLGAIQNRFDSTISNLQAISENLSASRSRIQDADFAAETANMSRAQILQQAGVSMLAQANAAPQMVLKLLQ